MVLIVKYFFLVTSGKIYQSSLSTLQAGSKSYRLLAHKNIWDIIFWLMLCHLTTRYLIGQEISPVNIYYHK